MDDDEAVRNGIRRILEKAGYRVLSASTVVQAVELAADHERAIHVLLTDYALPGVTGRDLARAMARGRADLRVLYISGHDERDLSMAGELGPHTSFLQKPFAAATLVQRVAELLGSSSRGSAVAGGK